MQPEPTSPHTSTRRTRRALGTSLLAGAALSTSLLAGVAAPAGAVDTRNWSIDVNSIRSVVQQETNLTGGDEVELATIAFRSTPGVDGSTSAWFTGGIDPIDNVHQGEVHAVPNSTGRVVFQNVTRRSAAQIFAGESPEIIGTLTVVLEDDLTSTNRINDMMVDIADVVEAEVADLLEPLDLLNLPPGGIAGALGGALADIEDEITPTTLQKIGLFLGSFGDPDDLIAYKVNVFVAVDETLGAAVDDVMADAIPASEGVGGALRNRSYNQTFTGDGASYRLAYVVS
jgi:hypothetical protein